MRKKEKIVIFAILIGIILFHIINNYIISTFDLAPFFHDVASCVRAGFRTYSLLVQYKFFYVFFGPHYYYYPISFHIFSFPFYSLFGLNQKSAVMTNFIFLGVLVFSVYGTGRLLHSKKVGVLSAFIVTSFPGVFSLSRTYMPDFALTAMVALSIYCLLKTREFTQKKFSILLGLAAGLGMAIKTSFFIFFLGPFCYYLFVSFRCVYNRTERFKRIKNLIIFLVINLILVLFFYIPNFLFKMNCMFDAVFGSSHGAALKLFSLEAILSYPKYLFTTQILYFYFALLLLGTVLFLKSNKKYKFLPFLWFLVPYLFFTFCVRRYPIFRYTAPYLPAIALIIAIGLFDLRKAIIRRILIFLVILAGLFQFFLISYVPSGNFLIEHLNQEFFLSPDNYFIQQAYSTAERPYAYDTDYGVGTIVDCIQKSNRFNKQSQINIFDATGRGIARPTEYLLYQDKSSFKKMSGYNYHLLCNRLYVSGAVTEDCIAELTKMLDDIDFLVLSSDIDRFTDLKNIALKNMVLIQKIKSEPDKDLYLFENKNYVQEEHIQEEYVQEESIQEVYTQEMYTQEKGYDYQSSNCKDCTINLSYLNNNLLKSSYDIPHNKKDWQIFLHKIWERLSGVSVDYGWVQVSKQLNNVDWSNFTSLNLLVKGEGKPTKIELSVLEADGDEWFYFDSTSLSNDNWTLVTCSFKDFTNPRWAKHGDKKKNLDNIISIKITLTSFDKIVTQTIYFKLFEGEIFYLNSF